MRCKRKSGRGKQMFCSQEREWRRRNWKGEEMMEDVEG